MEIDIEDSDVRYLISDITLDSTLFSAILEVLISGSADLFITDIRLVTYLCIFVIVLQ
jgi:hypothetical protein